MAEQPLVAGYLHRVAPSSVFFTVELPVSSRRPEYTDPEEAEIRRRTLHKMISAELEDFLRYLSSPWHILWRNMLVGLTRGLGAIFGVTVVVGVAIWVLKIFIDLPLIGSYARDFRDRVTEVAEETRYTDDFQRLQSTLERIDLRLKEQNELLQTLQSQSDTLQVGSVDDQP